jgi:hypothetical protein
MPKPLNLFYEFQQIVVSLSQLIDYGLIWLTVRAQPLLLNSLLYYSKAVVKINDMIHYSPFLTFWLTQCYQFFHTIYLILFKRLAYKEPTGQWISYSYITLGAWKEHYFYGHTDILAELNDLINKGFDPDTKEVLLIAKYNEDMLVCDSFTRGRPPNAQRLDPVLVPSPFLDIEYRHPLMKRSLRLSVDSRYFVVNNELFSPLFVKRCLEYQNEPFVFDADYKITIFTANFQFIDLTKNQRIRIQGQRYSNHEDEEKVKVKEKEKERYTIIQVE